MRTLMSAAALWTVLALAAAARARASKTADPGQDTVWEQLMQAQANRGMVEGSEQLRARRYDEAVRELAKAVLASPKDPLARLLLGSAYYWSGKVDQAEAEFREGLRLDPGNAQGHLLLGIVHAWRGNAKSAYASFLEAERLDPARADVRMNLGSMEQGMGLYPQALDHLRKAVSLEPENPLYHFQLGSLYRRLGRYAEAEESMRAALKHYPEFEDALFELGAALERLGKAGDAEDAFRKAVRLKPRDAAARYRLARACLQRGDRDKARSFMRDAFHLTPEEAGGGLALSLSFGGQPKQGAGSPGGPSPDAPAPAAEDAQNPVEVVARNLERVPLDQEAKLQVQMVFLPRPQLVPAKSREGAGALKRALEAAGRPAPSATGVQREFSLPPADAAKRRTQIDQIRRELQGAAAQAPPDAQVRLGMRLELAQARVKPGGTGRGDGDAPVSYQPRQVGNDLGLWVLGTGWMTLVEETLPESDSETREPEGADDWVLRGLGYAVLGQGPQALEAFDRALGTEPKDEQALLGRAVALVEMGREKEAVSAYKRLLELHPKNRVAREGLEWLQRAPAAGPRRFP